VYPPDEDVGFANMCVLEDVPRERILFGAKDNLNDHIKNGVQDTVVSFLNGLPVVATASESLRVDRAA
ncbi:unnamed protein product, partial [Porites evermanni]